MPNAKQFLKGFGLQKGLEIAEYTLKDIQIQHIEVVRYHQYLYPISLTFEGNGNSDQLVGELRKMTSDSKIIYTSYGNPYSCNIRGWYIKSKSGNQVVIATEGDATRI